MEVTSVGTVPSSAPNDRDRARRTALRWATRATWALAALAATPGLDRVTTSSSTSVRITAMAVFWAYWFAGVVGSVIARDPGTTIVRVVAPIGTIAAIVGVGRGLVTDDTVLVVTAAATALLTLWCWSSPALQSLVDAASYGSEARYPLRTPPAVAGIGMPLAWACLGIATIVGPLLLASGRLVEGLACCVIGAPLAALSVRSVHTLSVRWLVLVPAGVVVRDPMILTDPILVPRDHIAAITSATGEPISDAIDLRLGAFVGTVRITCTEPTEGMRVKRSRRNTRPVDSDKFLVAVTQRRAFLRDYHRRAPHMRSPE